MKGYKEYFKGKKVTMLGLGLLGRGLGDAKFLAECGADLIVTDLKTKEELAPTLKKLAKYKNIKYTLGEHKLEDFRDRDFILKAAGVPLNSPYIEEARKNNIPVEMEGSLFAKLTDGVTFVGVTGTRGKTTTTYVIYEILKTAFPGKVYLGGNIRGMATLPLIKKIKAGDIMVMELDSWQLQGWGESNLSPHVSVFTNFLDDHINYYLKGSVSEAEAVQKYFYDKAHIFRNQNKEHSLIIDAKMKKEIQARHQGKIQSKIITPKKTSIDTWKLKVKGEHNKENILKGIEVARVLGVSEKIIKKAVENFRGVPGRLEFLREYKGIKIYNDTTATTPDATIAALKALATKQKNIILIMGGADKNLEMTELIKTVPRYCKNVILLEGSGTQKIEDKILGVVVKSLKGAVSEALGMAKKGDIILLSPAFASFGMFKNEYDRGDQFVKIVKSLR
jgi:UDP-N-acetylmuramoylalanine--D-glutamate ligase